MKITLPPVPVITLPRIVVQRHSTGHATLSIDGHAAVLKRSELCALINHINAVLPKLRG